MQIAYVHPVTHKPLLRTETGWVCPDTKACIAPIIRGIPRFVTPEENYAESFGWQWNKWRHTRSDSRNSDYCSSSIELLKRRTHFDEYITEGKTILECGMGGGDDTEALLKWPFSELHSFDISSGVERAHAYLKDPRLHIYQGSIFDIPFPDRSFDFVFCHRVLQHTPDPARALRCVCRKVKPGGILFAHIYKRSKIAMREWKYKYRWLTKRLPWSWTYRYVQLFGTPLHHVKNVMYKWKPTRQIAYRLIPFDHRVEPLPSKELTIELEKLITFDALTPMYDLPMTTEEFISIITDEGFRIDHLSDPPATPIYATAVKL